MAMPRLCIHGKLSVQDYRKSDPTERYEYGLPDQCWLCPFCSTNAQHGPHDICPKPKEVYLIIAAGPTKPVLVRAAAFEITSKKRSFLDEYLIKEVGDSCANSNPEPGITWGCDANSLIRDGRHLLTKEELRMKREEAELQE
jgi:hypothetical protein